ncbi:uroplakin-3b-like protein 1 [Pyrgilauda ruficollis]|uniref:uroplakin-3b-like protein 1 n=1 Tax=Pyrgilauda ruficollis TaxID=221976 RepID=UPI001B8751B5|nr:uroplakin-3b-like protein 1 [Pyrgilauda ruficollis]
MPQTQRLSARLAGGRSNITKAAGETSPTCLPRGCGPAGMWAVGDHRRLPGDAEPQPHSRPRHPGARTMLPLLLLLLPAAHGIARLGPRPALTQEQLEGLTTASTFVLEQPRCVFGEYGNAVIWLVVALEKDASAFNSSSAVPGTPETAFQSFPDPVRAYMTLNATLSSYPCPKPPGDITVLRVGSETSCAQDTTRPTCNGPLPGPGPYRVKFLALEGSVPVADTEWSMPIMLRTAKSPSSIPTTSGGHNAGMIAIATILSILFAILLAGLVAMLVFWGSDSCGGSSSFSKPESVTVRRYNTHHVYDQPAARL